MNVACLAQVLMAESITVIPHLQQFRVCAKERMFGFGRAREEQIFRGWWLLQDFSTCP